MLEALLDFPFWRPICAALSLGLLLPIFGRNLVLGRCVLLGLAAPQITMLGIVVAFNLAAMQWIGLQIFQDEGKLAILGGLAAGIPTLLLAGRLGASQRLVEPVLLCVYLGAGSATNLLLAAGPVGEPYLRDLLQGRLLLVSEGALLALLTFVGAGAGICLFFQRRLLLVLSDPEYAQITGIKVARWKQAQLLLGGMATGMAVAVAGPTVTFALLVLPALTSAMLTKSLNAHLYVSCLLGAVGALGGFALSLWRDWPSGDCVTGTVCVIYAAALSYARRKEG